MEWEEEKKKVRSEGESERRKEERREGKEWNEK